MTLDPKELPPLDTGDLPGIGGKIKERTEDFEVEEIPAYLPSGTGPFLYLFVEKQDMGAEYFTRELARRLNLPTGEIGIAGLKDRRALTRQWVSVPASAEPLVSQLNVPGIRVLESSYHTNKLRTGHLRGNRFRILIRGVSAGAETLLPPLAERINRQGFANFYGPQRFGKDGETCLMGLELLKNAGNSQRRLSPFLRKLALSAAQALLFNHWLAVRLQDGLLRKVMEGDVMAKVPTGGLFRVTDVETEQARFDQRETVHTGPIFGRKMFSSAAVALERENEILREATLEARHFFGFGKLLAGTRRAALVYPGELRAEITSEGAQLRFELPAGCYATVLLREIMKSSLLDGDEIA